MKELIKLLRGKKADIPKELEIVIICRALSIDYWRFMEQPQWFLDYYQLLLAGEKTVLEMEKLKGRELH